MRRLPDLLQAFRGKASVRAVGVMAMSSGLGQLAIFCTLPLLTRLYEPAAFGLHAMFMAFVGIASVGACLCLDHRIVSTADDATADEVFTVALMCVPITALISAVVLAALIAFDLFGYHKLPIWCVPLMGLMIGLNGVFSACRSRVVRQQDFALVAKTGLTQNIGRSIAPVIMFAVAPFWFGLTGGELAARTLGVRSLTRRVWHRRSSELGWRRPSAWWAIVKREYRFTGVLMGTVLVDACASQMITPLLVGTYGAQVAGVYFLAFMLIVGPSVLVGIAAADVIHAKGAEIFHRDPAALPAFARQAALLLLALSLAIFAPLYLLAPYVLPPIFGAKWSQVAQAVQALTPFAVVGFIASPYSRLLVSLNKPMIKVVPDTVRLVGVPLTIFLSHASGATFIQALWNLSWFLAAAYGLYFAITYITMMLNVSGKK